VYRLLIVTHDPDTIERLSTMQGWEKLGFKQPTLCRTAEEAIDMLSKRQVDAIAVDDAPEMEGFLTYLDERHPNKPLFEIAATQEEQREVLRQLGMLLNRMRADDSNDAYDDAYRLQIERERWLKRLIGGMVTTQDEMRRQMRLYRCCERLDVPCVLARMEMSDDDGFLSNRWHYGGERLEQALRNFFGYEHDQMRMHVAVVSQEEVRVLCYPASEEEGISENAAFEYVQETLDQVDHYLGLHMKVLEVRRVPGLLAFAQSGNA